MKLGRTRLQNVLWRTNCEVRLSKEGKLTRLSAERERNKLEVERGDTWTRKRTHSDRKLAMKTKEKRTRLKYAWIYKGVRTTGKKCVITRISFATGEILSPRDVQITTIMLINILSSGTRGVAEKQGCEVGIGRNLMLLESELEVTVLRNNICFCYFLFYLFIFFFKSLYLSVGVWVG